jgi:hypothetical protein
LQEDWGSSAVRDPPRAPAALAIDPAPAIGERLAGSHRRIAMSGLSNSRIAWFNGEFMPEGQVMIPFRDRSWKYGDGAFDMTRTFEGKPFRL